MTRNLRIYSGVEFVLMRMEIDIAVLVMKFTPRVMEMKSAVFLLCIYTYEGRVSHHCP